MENPTITTQAPPQPRRDSSSPRVSRRSSTVRVKPRTYRSNSSLRPTPLPTPRTPKPPGGDDASLVSFPSLALENSPANDNILEHTTPRASPLPSARPVPKALAALFSPSIAQDGETSLFGDRLGDIKDVPGTLHHQSDKHVQHLIDKTGAVALVKQLAQDLAERDAEITLFQRRAEEREALLRKMLRECEVSNLDVEHRLAELRKGRNGNEADTFGGDLRKANGKSNGGVRPEASIRERLFEAFGDELESGTASRDELQQRSDEDMMKTVKARQTQRITSDTMSVASVGSTESGTRRGWKGLFGYGGGTVKASRPTSITAAQPDTTSTGNSTVQINRDGNSTRRTSVFDHNDSGTSTTGTSSAQRSRAGSGAPLTKSASNHSPAMWALRMVVGSGQPDPDAQKRIRASTVAATGNSSGTQRLRSKPSIDAGITNHIGPFASSTGPTGTIKRSGADAARALTANLVPPSSDVADSAVANLGPVEMDAIVPDETLPPALMQYNNYRRTGDMLTDRFGFIYDQRRRRRQNEAAAALPQKQNTETVLNHRKSLMSMSPENDVDDNKHNKSVSGLTRPETPQSLAEPEEAPAKRWQDYLSLSVFGTELLSHTPSSAPITVITTGDSPPNESNEFEVEPEATSKRASLPLLSTVSTPLAPSISSDTANTVHSAGTTRPSSSNSRLQTDPVKALLDQVNDVHDNLQKQKTARWNDFYRKVRAERKRDGDAGFTSTSSRAKNQTSSMPETLLVDGEVIGIAGLGVKGKVGRAKGNEFRNLVLSGIPLSYRAKVWAESSGAHTMRIPGYYDELVSSAPSNTTDESIVQQIKMDITRTLTDNIYFRLGPGVAKLNEVLLAYARRNPDIGYCQGMNLIAGNLLLVVPTAEDAFWLLASIVEETLPPKYYDSSLLASRADQVVLRDYVSTVLPALSAHLDELSIDLEAVTFQWFLSVFTDCLSAEALLRVWDVIFCLGDGATFLFQVALALLKLNETSLLACESPAEVYGYVNGRMTDHAISIDGLIRASEGLKGQVKREDVIAKRAEAIEAELARISARQNIRAGKKRAASPPQATTTTTSATISSNTSLHDSGIEEVVKTRAGRLTRQSSRASFGLSTKDEEDMDLISGGWDYDGLARVSPMPYTPIDEEMGWRG